MQRHLHIDPFAGIAGDMFLGAMIHAGLSLDDLREALANLELDESYQLTADPVLRQGIAGIDFKVHVGDESESPSTQALVPALAQTPARSIGLRQETNRGHSRSHSHDHGHDHDHPHDHAHDSAHDHDHAQTHSHANDDAHHHRHHVHYAQMLALVDRLKTTSRGRDRARRMIDLLAQAEAQVHGMPIEKVHFHEVGAVDSIVDMLGAAAAMEIMGIDTVSCGAMPISRGFVRCDHGKMPVPAPAPAYLMRGMPTFGIDRNLEMITPTGAAIAAALSQSHGAPPPMTLRTIGYGAGDRDDADLPNLLRIFIGERVG